MVCAALISVTSLPVVSPCSNRAQLGDIVHALPVLTALRRRFPHAHITWIVNRAYEPLIQGHPDLDETLAFDRGATGHGLRMAWTTYHSFAQELRRRRFDLLIDLQGLLRSGIMAAASGARRIVGLSTAREGARWFYTDIVSIKNFKAIHAVDRYWRIVEELGVGGSPKQFHLPIADEAQHWAAEKLDVLPRPWMVVGAGSRWMTKRWPPEHFASLLSKSLAKFGGSVVFVGSADETPLAAQVRAQLNAPGLDLTGRSTLPQLTALLRRADVMLANDTGPLHLATALGRPVVAPYTCTRDNMTGPYAPNGGGAVETTVWCKGSYVKRCARMECMTELTPERLWPVLDEVLQRWQIRSLPA